MRRTPIRLLIFLGMVMLFLVGCTGSQGVPGPVGPAGAPGPLGPRGPAGQAATAKTFAIIKEIVEPYITNATETSIEIRNNSDRTVLIAFTSDPDIAIVEQMPSQKRPLLAIEIKGGRDVSNIHNRIGEAEKSHQKAKLANYREFITIISVEIAHDILKRESPTTNHFLNLDNLLNKNSEDHIRFKEIIASNLGIGV